MLGEHQRVGALVQGRSKRFAQPYDESQTMQGLAHMVESVIMALDSKEQYTSNHCRTE